jgi:hypothetical protein
MSSEEQKRILKMVEDGKISADEAMTLIRALEQDPAEEEVEVIEAAPGAGSATTDAPEFEEVKARARRFASIPLWIGVGGTVISAGLMYWAMQSSGFGFWFYCLTFPFLLSVLLIALSAGGFSTRWLFVDVHQKPGEKPGRITLGFPAPLGLMGWFFRHFGHHIHGIDRGKADQIVEMIKATAASKSPLIVSAQDDEDGERVMVYIG